MAHFNLVQRTLKDLDGLLQKDEIRLDGESLNLAAVVAVARHSKNALITESDNVIKRLQASVDTLMNSLDRGEQVYGVNTGCGGNADTRTQKLETLQHSFLQHHQCGVLPELASSNLLQGMEGSHRLSTDIVRGTMLLRCNSLLRGHSAVRIKVIQFILNALNAGIIPVIPQRGSISASGDLSPLSYIGGLIEGNPDIFAMTRQNGHPCIVSVAEALQKASLTPLRLNAKEGLGVMNGTATSAAAASLVLYDSHNLALLVQVITAMATEALVGTIDNYHDFISQARPHSGQAEAADNIRRSLSGSRLCHETDVHLSGLIQDRYALRTAPQWIGPQLEDLLAADRQMSVEMNATTDNPLIDVAGNRFHHGGNFQAASVTSAMEKTRSALTMLGRLLMAQCGELINPMLNRGLPPNLCADDPSLSFAMKGLDVHMTAYFSELGYLANSVGSHVQTAEMHNQAVNSLALIAARYTSQSVQIVSMMSAVQLYILCQALDLRALTMDFFAAAEKESKQVYADIYGSPDFDAVWEGVTTAWLDTSRQDLSDRCNTVSSRSFASIIEISNEISPAQRWKTALSRILYEQYDQTRAAFFRQHSTPSYLGNTTRAMYEFVRQTLDIPLHRGIEDHPTIGEGKGKKTIGAHVTKIYVAVREGRIMQPLRMQ